MLARQAAAIDDLSGGRLLLGLGAGWQEREHREFGHNLGTMKERMDRFEEGVKVISLLLTSDEPVSFEGRFFRLRGRVAVAAPAASGWPYHIDRGLRAQAHAAAGGALCRTLERGCPGPGGVPRIVGLPGRIAEGERQAAGRRDAVAHDYSDIRCRTGKSWGRCWKRRHSTMPA